VEKYCRAGQATDDNMVHAHCIPKATNTCSEYVIFIVFSLQERLQERVSMLHYTCIAYLVGHF